MFPEEDPCAPKLKVGIGRAEGNALQKKMLLTD